jgi:hypothetical protein
MTYSYDQKVRAGAVNYNPAADDYTTFYNNFKPPFVVPLFTEQGMVTDPSSLELIVRQLPVISDEHRKPLKHDRLPSMDAKDVSRVEISLLYMHQNNVRSIFELCEAEYNNPAHKGKQYLKYRSEEEIAQNLDFDPENGKGGLVLAYTIRDSYGTSHVASVVGHMLVDPTEPSAFGSGSVPLKEKVQRFGDQRVVVYEACDANEVIIYNMNVVHPLLQGSGYDIAKKMKPVRDNCALEMARKYNRPYFITKTNNPAVQAFYKKEKWPLPERLIESLRGKEGVLHTYIISIKEMINKVEHDEAVKKATAEFCASVEEKKKQEKEAALKEEFFNTRNNGLILAL